MHNWLLFFIGRVYTVYTMNDNNFEAVVKEKKHLPKWVKVMSRGVAVCVVAGGGYLYYVTHKQFPIPPLTSFVLSDELKAKVDAFVEEDESVRKQLAVLDTITVSAPGNTDDTDAAVYFAAFKSATSTGTSTVLIDTGDLIFRIGSTTFSEFLAQQTDRSRYDALFTHMRTSITHMSEVYKRPNLAERLTGVTLVGSAPDTFVYPSAYVADVYLTAAIADVIGEENTDSNSVIADDLVRQGMLSGWYGQSDIDATKLFVESYVAQISLREYLIRFMDSAPNN